jgi:hypothetical protein
MTDRTVVQNQNAATKASPTPPVSLGISRKCTTNSVVLARRKCVPFQTASATQALAFRERRISTSTCDEFIPDDSLAILSSADRVPLVVWPVLPPALRCRKFLLARSTLPPYPLRRHRPLFLIRKPNHNHYLSRNGNAEEVKSTASVLTTSLKRFALRTRGCGSSSSKRIGI